MTRIKKFWVSISFWMKLKASITVFGIGSEVSLFVMESHPGWKIVAAVATALGLLITYLIEDKNNNGKVDLFE